MGWLVVSSGQAAARAVMPSMATRINVVGKLRQKNSDVSMVFDLSEMVIRDNRAMGASTWGFPRRRSDSGACGGPARRSPGLPAGTDTWCREDCVLSVRRYGEGTKFHSASGL